MNQDDGRDLEESLVNSIVKAELVDTGVDLAEVGIDHFLQDGVFRDVPIVGVMIGVVRTFGVVRDRLFANKVIRFLVGLAKVPINEREAFLARHATPAERRRLGETLLLLLDRLDDIQKPEPLSRLFTAYMRGDYDFEKFRRLASALDHVPLSAIPQLKILYQTQDQSFGMQSPTRPSEHHGQFVLAGLVDIEFHRTGPTGGPGGRYAKNELGALFLKVLAP